MFERAGSRGTLWRAWLAGAAWWCAGGVFVSIGQATDDVYVFSRFAGVVNDYGVGSMDGFGETGRLDRPHSVAVDQAGNVYVADFGNHTIRKITPYRIMSTIAGTAGLRGSEDGIGAEARFNNPDGLAVDASGNLYVADSGNYTVRKITPQGVVSTLAGLAGVSGSQTGSGSAARFVYPVAVTVDGAGNIYVAQIADTAIRKITPSGVVTILAGNPDRGGAVDGDAATARFSACDGIAADGAGNVYVSDMGSNTLRKISPTGDVTTLAGAPKQSGFADGVGPAARFDSPRKLALDAAGNLYVADQINNAIRKVTAAGEVSTLAGVLGLYGTADGTTADARFTWPYGVGVGPQGEVYVADTENATVRRISPAGIVSTLVGRPGGGSYGDGASTRAQFRSPSAVVVDRQRNVYVADSFNYVIRKITPAGIVTTFAGLGGAAAYADGAGSTARFTRPVGLAIDRDGHLYVADRSAHRIAKITPEGRVTTLAGVSGTPGSADGAGLTDAQFSGPAGVAVNAAGVVYVADADNHTLRSISPDGHVTTLAGAARQPGTVDGTGSAARFYAPAAVAVDGVGDVYVADSWTGAVRKVTPAGVVTTLTGPRHVDRQPPNGSGYTASGITVDPAGYVFVADSFGNTIIRVSPDGTVFTIGGGRQREGDADGPGDEARFQGPSGIAVDDVGNLYVADAGSNAVKRGVRQSATKPALALQPESITAVSNQSIVLNAQTSTRPVATLQWYRNGTVVPDGSSTALTFSRFRPEETGLYAVAAIGSLETVSSVTAIVGLAIDRKVAGAGEELRPADVRHPNGNVMDQVLLTGAAAAVTADYDPDPKKNQITRTSFIDLDDDIVQVEFSGPGTLSLVLDSATGPAGPVNYNQATTYMKGHAGIVIAGATEQTNVSVFSVGKANAVNQALFKEGVKYDGIADLAFIAILSSNGKFGGVRTANANYFAAKGLTGLYAPGVIFEGPVFIGDITAFDAATPVIQVGAVGDARITGGDLAQANGVAVQVSGLTQLKFTPGGDSHGNTLPAQKNKAVLTQDGVDVTAQVVVNP